MPQKEFKYSVFKSVFRPVWIVSDKLGTFFFWAGIFALVLTGLSLLFSAAFECSLVFKRGVTLCVERPAAYISYFITKILLISVFIRLWTEATVSSDEPFHFLQVLKGILRAFLSLAIFIGANLLPMLAGHVLYFRTPNPNWIVELMFFTLIALGFLAPFILMRFYPAIGAFLESGARVPVYQSFIATLGWGFKLVLSTAFLYMLILFIFISGNSAALTMPYYLSMFVQNMVLLLNVALATSFMLTQKQMFLDAK